MRRKIWNRRGFHANRRPGKHAFQPSAQKRVRLRTRRHGAHSFSNLHAHDVCRNRPRKRDGQHGNSARFTDAPHLYNHRKSGPVFRALNPNCGGVHISRKYAIRRSHTGKHRAHLRNFHIVHTARAEYRHNRLHARKYAANRHVYNDLGIYASDGAVVGNGFPNRKHAAHSSISFRNRTRKMVHILFARRHAKGLRHRPYSKGHCGDACHGILFRDCQPCEIQNQT